MYVNDILISRDDKPGIASLERILQAYFHMKDLEHLTYFPGLEVTPAAIGVSFSLIINIKRISLTWPEC